MVRISIKQKIGILVILSLVIAGGVVIAYFIRGGNSERFGNSQQSQSSVGAVMRRRYVSSAVLKLQRSFSLPQSAYRPISYKGHLFIQLWNECQIARIDSTGKIEQLYGRKGSAPGEFKNISDVSIDSSGIYVTDANNLTLNHYRFDGSLAASHPLKTGIFLSSRLTGTRYILRGLDPGDIDTERLQVYDVISQFSIPVNVPRMLRSHTNDAGRGMEFAAFSIPNRAGRSFFVYLASGQFMAFDTSGTMLYQRRTIDESPLPKILVRKIGKEDLAMPAPDAREVNIGGDADDAYLYILSNAAAPDIPQLSPTINKIGVIDIYDVASGSYRCSIKIPPVDANGKNNTTTPRQIAVGKNEMYIMMGDNLILYYSFDRALL